MIAREHYWSTGGYNDQAFRMRSASTVVFSFSTFSCRDAGVE